MRPTGVKWRGWIEYYLTLRGYVWKSPSWDVLKIIINNIRLELALNVLNYVAVHSPIPIFIWLAFTVVVALCYHDKVFFKVALNESQVNIVWPGLVPPTKGLGVFNRDQHVCRYLSGTFYLVWICFRNALAAQIQTPSKHLYLEQGGGQQLSADVYC